MRIRFTLNNRTRRALWQRLHLAYQGGDIRLIRRVHCLLYLADGKAVAEVARVLNLGAQTVYHHLCTKRDNRTTETGRHRPVGRRVPSIAHKRPAVPKKWHFWPCQWW